MSKIKIMHVAEAAGGVDRFLQMLFKNIDHKVFYTILVCSQNYDTEEYKTITDKVMQIDMAHDFSIERDVKSIKRIKMLIKENDPDIVFAHSSKAGALLRASNFKMDNISVYNPHGWAFNMNTSFFNKAIYSLAEKIGAYMSDYIVCISESEKDSAIKNNICETNKIKVIFNGIDVDLKPSYLIRRKDLGFPENSVVIGMVGRLSKQKSPEIFIEMANLIKQKVKNAYFLLVGDGDLKNEIEKDIAKYNLSDCTKITGWVKQPEQYMRLFTVGVLLSKWEGFGLVLPEYMRAGVPIVATNVDAIPNILEDGKDSTLVNPNDPEAAAEAVLRLIDNPSIADMYIDAGYMKVRNNFNIKRTAKEYESFWLKIYENKKL